MNNFYNRNDPRDLLSLYDDHVKSNRKIDLREIDFIHLTEYLRSEVGEDDAMEVVENGILQYRFSPRLYTCKAELLLAQGESELALDALDRAEIFGQSFVTTDVLRARVHTASDDFTTALNILTELRFTFRLNPQQLSQIYLTEAYVYEKQELHYQEYQSLRAAAIADPYNNEVLERLFLAAHLSNMQRDSIDLHNRILNENPYAYLAWFNLAQAHLYFCEYREALTAFEYSFLSNQKFEPAYKEYIELCLQKKYYEEAMTALEDAMCYLSDQDEELLLQMGQCYEFMGNTTKAKVYYYRALELNSWMDEIYFHIGECYRKEENYSGSIHFYKQAIRIDALHEEYQLALAIVYRALGRYQKALPYYQRATSGGPELAENWLEYADFLIELDGLEEALEVLEEAKCFACSPELDFCQIAILYRLGRRKEALQTMMETMQEGVPFSACLFEYAPQASSDKEIKAILRYYEQENENY